METSDEKTPNLPIVAICDTHVYVALRKKWDTEWKKIEAANQNLFHAIVYAMELAVNLENAVDRDDVEWLDLRPGS